MTSSRSLLGCFLATMAMTCTGRAQEYRIEPLGFGTTLGSSSDAEFTVRGQLCPLPGGILVAPGFELEGTLQTLSPAALGPAMERLANGGFEDLLATFSPDATGTQLISIPASRTNLLPYGDAEGLVIADGTITVPIPGWTLVGPISVVAWDLPGGWPLYSDPGPPDRGAHFFAGGPEDGRSGNLNTATTRVTLPLDAAVIDAGQTPFELSGWFGGFQGQADTAALRASFFDAAGARIESFLVGAPTPEQRQNRTALVFDGLTGSVPPRAREVEVVLEMRRQANLGWNDGYADNLVFAVPREPAAALPGWRVLHGNVLWCSNTNTLGPRSPHGGMFLDLTGARGTPPWGGIAQEVTTIPGASYELRFALGTYQDLPAFRGPVGVRVSVGTATNTFTFTPDPGSTGSQWRDFTQPFTATGPATPVSIVGIQSAGGAFLGLDHVAVVPAESADRPTLQISFPFGSANATEFELRFPSVTGRFYRVQRAAEVTPATWQDVIGTERLGDGSGLSVRLVMPPGTGTHFFRLRVDP